MTWEAIVREGDDGFGPPRGRGTIGVTVYACDWKDAFDVVGNTLTGVARPYGELTTGPAKQRVRSSETERPTSWEHVTSGPNHDEARKLARDWTRSNSGSTPALDDSLTALIEGLLDRVNPPSE